MKFISNRGPRAENSRVEAVVTRLITVVLGSYALALFAQTAGVITFV
jgi:hypothetical protein